MNLVAKLVKSDISRLENLIAMFMTAITANKATLAIAKHVNMSLLNTSSFIINNIWTED